MLTNPYEWRVVSERPGKRILMKVDPVTDEVVVCEEWLEDVVLEEAREQRERPMLVSPDLKPLAVVPPSVMNKSIREGWVHDDKAWKSWINDIDNNKLKLTDGKA
jgi:hypothetical protein